jgi:predicted house-cleaning noncanonical NTP pyrophosphatase (MazG superfamily)
MKFKHTKTNIPEENEYPKLVRDLIPDIIESHGEISKTRIAKDNDEFRVYLLAKMVEESNELKNTKNKDHLVEELADIMEIIDTILGLENLSLEDIRNIQKEKKEKRGGFEKRIIMLNNKS